MTKVTVLKKRVLIPAIIGVLTLGMYSSDAFTTEQQSIATEGDLCAWDLVEGCAMPEATLNCSCE